ncbi:unnamed protein product [Prunus armeniaca]|uniref:Uncharacterized protein n=1 Tax=Prunus armeniaca TaxID=36596 RepID=A0A6J5WBN4_PRUAR|nr:unnamed protein product [Prunus armeniaca]
MSTVAVFPCVEELSLSSLMQLKNAPSHFPSLQKLNIHVLHNVMPIENICSQLTTHTSLYMQGIKELTSLPVGMVEKNENLWSLIIGHFENLTHLPDGLLHKLPLLDELFISSFPNLELILITKGVPCLLELNIKDFLPPSLLMLEVEFCGALTSLAGGLECLTTLQQFTSLCKLFIYDYELESINSSLEELSLLGCTSLYLMHLPIDGLQTLVSLEELRICYCPNLEAVPSLNNLTSLLSDPFGTSNNWSVLRELDCFLDFEAPPRVQKIRLWGWLKLKSLPQQIQHFTSLISLSIISLTKWRLCPSVFGLPCPPPATPSNGMGTKRTSTSSSTNPTPQPLPTAVWIAGKSKKLAGFYPKSPSHVRAISATKFFDLGMLFHPLNVF